MWRLLLASVIIDIHLVIGNVECVSWSHDDITPHSCSRGQLWRLVACLQSLAAGTTLNFNYNLLGLGPGWWLVTGEWCGVIVEWILWPDCGNSLCPYNYRNRGLIKLNGLGLAAETVIKKHPLKHHQTENQKYKTTISSSASSGELIIFLSWKVMVEG